MITLHNEGGGKYRVSVECGGVTVTSPTREFDAMLKLYSYLKGLDNDRAAMIRLTRLCIYQVCND